MTKRREGTTADVKGREKLDGTKRIHNRRNKRQKEWTKERERTTAETKDRNNGRRERRTAETTDREN